MSKKRPDRERLRERWVDAQELSGGPFRIGSINRHRKFALLKSHDLILDGEACAHDSNGHPDFWEVRVAGELAWLYAFDLLRLDGEDLRRSALEQRKGPAPSVSRAGRLTRVGANSDEIRRNVDLAVRRL